MILQWHEEFSVGVPELDKHHRHLIEILNALVTAVNEGNNLKIIAGLMTDLNEYTVYHFNAEEALFIKVQYPHVTQHIQEHQEFIDRLSRIDQLLQRDQHVAAAELEEMLISWIMNHILTSDRMYMSYLSH